jgi:hypothetical protein
VAAVDLEYAPFWKEDSGEDIFTPHLDCVHYFLSEGFDTRQR